MRKMKAAFIEKQGDWDVIQYGDLKIPECGPSQVLIKVSIVPVNYADLIIRSGQLHIPNMPFPFILGRDMCGVVQAVGRDVKTFCVQDRVWCNNQGIKGRLGTCAEYIVVDEDLLYHMPNTADEQQVAALLHSSLTVYFAFIKKVPIKEGDTVFIKGGAGNVGSVALQIAHHLKAKVIVTARTAEQIKWCYSCGADRVISYTKEDVVKKTLDFSPHGVDIYLDTTPTPNFEEAITVLAYEGKMITIAGLNVRPHFPVGPFYVKNCTLFGFAIYNATIEEFASASSVLNHWFTEGFLKAKIHSILPLSSTKKAHQFLEQQQHVWGKILLKI